MAENFIENKFIIDKTNAKGEIDNNVFGVFQIDNNGVFVKSNEGLDYFNYSNFNFKRIQDKSKPIHHIFKETKSDQFFPRLYGGRR